MKTIAQKYIEEGENRGEARGIQIGKSEGIQIEKFSIAKNLKKAKILLRIISQTTGLTEDEINKIKD